MVRTAARRISIVALSGAATVLSVRPRARETDKFGIFGREFCKSACSERERQWPVNF